jgi:glyceraldehyde 3-phosphate dehydrogenase
VILSAPAKGPQAADANIVLGVNFDEVYDPARHHTVANASCTTNCLAPVAKDLHETIGIRYSLNTTIHAYTADQSLLDGPHKGPSGASARRPPTSCRPRREPPRRSDSSCPSSTAGSTAIAVRVPVPTGSLVDLTIEAERPTSAVEVNAPFADRAAPRADRRNPRLQRRAVSADIVQSPYSAIFDAPLTTVVDGTQVKGRRLV